MTAPWLEQRNAHNRDYYLSSKAARRPVVPVPLSRTVRNAEWVAQYASGLSTTEIAARWEMAHGESCYPELVRRTLRILGVTMRPRGTRTNGRRSLVARVRQLEEQVEKLLAGPGAA